MSIYSKLLKYNLKVDYIVIQVGYEGRIKNEWIEEIQHSFETDNPTSKTKIISICERKFNDTKYPTIYQKLKEKNSWSSSGVLIETDSIGNGLDISSRLMKYDFCGCYSDDTLYEFKTFKIEDYTILVLYYDTESG